MDGALLVYAGDSHKEAQVTGAIASNLWGAYHSHTESADIGGLEQIMMDCEEGRLFITKVASVLLCLTADASVGFGMLKAKAAALIHHLEGPLQKVDMH
eukprot:gene2626-24258_t